MADAGLNNSRPEVLEPPTTMRKRGIGKTTFTQKNQTGFLKQMAAELSRS